MLLNIPKKGELVIAQEDLPECPAIDCPGHMTARKSRYGKTFYSCSTFPECDVIVNSIDDLQTKYPDHPRTAYTKVAKKGKGKAAPKGKATKASKEKKPTKAKAVKQKKPSNQPKAKLSSELSKLLGETELSRPEITKKLWDYIKANNLQDGANKRLIVPDAALAKIFGSKEPVDMMKLASIISKHIVK